VANASPASNLTPTLQGDKTNATLPFYQRPALLLWGGILPLAILLRLLNLNTRIFWLDEFYSIATASLDPAPFWLAITRIEPNMALYYVMLRGWLRLGDSEVFVRLLSILFGVATMPVLYSLGRRLFGARTALVGTLFLSVNAFHVWYSQEARGYSLLVLLATLSSYFFVAGISKPSLRNWCWYTLTTALAVYTHVFGFLLLPAHWGSLPFLPKSQAPWKRLVASYAAIAVLELPLALFVLTHRKGPIVWVPKLGLGSIGGYLLALTGEGGLPLFALHGFFCLLALLAVVFNGSHSSNGKPAWGLIFIIAWLAIPVGLAAAASLVQPMFVSRFLILCLPPFALLSARGAVSLRPRWLFVAALGLVTLLSVPAIFRYARVDTMKWTVRIEWRDACQYVLAHSSKQDAVALHPASATLAYHYYEGRADASHRPVTVFPRSSWNEVQLLRGQGSYTDEPGSALIQSLPSSYDRIWLVVLSSNSSDWKDTRASLAALYPVHSEKLYFGISVELYSKGQTRKAAESPNIRRHSLHNRSAESAKMAMVQALPNHSWTPNMQYRSVQRMNRSGIPIRRSPENCPASPPGDKRCSSNLRAGCEPVPRCRLDGTQAGDQ
jgi:mannosyltransferase